ncbi:general stress protein [Paenibacillus montaniterrae]|uniref:general stress protein n=1 Tax=Paenibacillus montaniterrae TaxID=429341 RepID=UPI001BD151CA|nr:general stress protein [Paenibacillus montaniterrae]
MRKRIEKRLSYLHSGELFAAISFIFVACYASYVYPSLRLYALFSFWTSFILLELLLLQGSMYWHSKIKRLREEHTIATPIKIVRQLHRLKSLNLALIILSGLAFMFDLIKWQSSTPTASLVIAFFIYAFAVLEYINYFHIQLSYDSISDIKNLLQSRRLKQSSMNKDFKRLSKYTGK